MAHELEETISRAPGYVWKLRTSKALRGIGTQSRLTRWEDDGKGFLSIPMFSISGTVVAENAKRATVANVAAVHALGKAEALARLAQETPA